MLLAVLSGFILSALSFAGGKLIKGKLSFLPGLVPLALFVYFLSFLGEVSTDQSIYQENPWVPSLGIHLGFHLDGLSLIFALMITGIGALVFFYTANYLKDHPYLDRFFAYLAMFMSAMLGLVLSDNLITLFIFWELTSISSFFLIGFNNESASSRNSALRALAITGLGGLCLLAAAILIGLEGGQLSIQEILASNESLKDSALYPIMVFLILAAAFTKSAQFPFHFWLPGAMKAPTPVSTYLHSATMVKAGVYLVMRMGPVLGDHPFWNYPLLLAGGFTMMYAAIHTLFRTDMKGILAYSTISALGILIFLCGLGTDEAFIAATVFLLVHACYKACLFLITGVIDHETGTRDVTKLAGLAKLMLPVAIAGFLAALSNAGFPPTFGFLGKDLIYEASLAHPLFHQLCTGALVLTNVLLLYAGFQCGLRPFLGKTPEQFKNTHPASPWLWVPPLILGLASLLFGLFPGLIENSLIRPGSVALGNQDPSFHLKLWHGFNTVLLLSGITLALGIGLYWLLRPSKALEKAIAKLDVLAPIELFDRLALAFQGFAHLWTKNLQNGFLRNYILVIMLFLIGLMVYGLGNEFTIFAEWRQVAELTIYEIAVLLIMIAAIGYTVFTSSRLAAVASMGIVGYSLCLIFVFYSAPDLAMTQFSIDTLTVILFVLVLYRLPRYRSFSSRLTRMRDGTVAIAFGLLITTLVLDVIQGKKNSEIGDYYSENAYTIAKGKNVVNVILVDYRGLDTLVEITVLVIAAIGVFGLLKLRLRQVEKR